MIKTEKIIVLGGGSAGWMTAATLISQFPNKDITVIESPNTPIIGVGESTLGAINDWLKLLNIKDEDFMPHTDASYKLSIRFENFYEKGDGGFHYPFGEICEKDLRLGKQNWFFEKDKPVTDFANFTNSQMALVNQNTIFKNEDGILPNFDFSKDVAYHFDAIKFGAWLRENYCKPRGVKHIVEDIDVDNILIGEDGNIICLNKVSQENKLEADLFIDCTGFKSMLLNHVGAEFISYNDLLPNNHAWATRMPYINKEEQLRPYTNCTALGNGWVWNIPSWERIGTGYVFSDKYISKDEALDEFKDYLKSNGNDVDNLQFKLIPMRVGIHKEIFKKNVCGIGLSAGFIEPLESNGLLSVHEFLKRLVKLLERNGDKVSRYDIDGFNYSCKRFFDSFAMFVSTHYALSHRDDTEYWKDISNKSFHSMAKTTDEPDYCNKDTEVIHNDQHFYNAAYGMTYVSVGLRQKSYTKVDVNSHFNWLIDEILEQNKYRYSLVNKWNNIAKQQPSLYEYLKNNIHGDKNE